MSKKYADDEFREAIATPEDRRPWDGLARMAAYGLLPDFAMTREERDEFADNLAALMAYAAGKARRTP